MNYFYLEGSTPVGPICEADLRVLFVAGKIEETTLICQEAGQTWFLAGKLIDGPQVSPTALPIPKSANRSKLNWFRVLLTTVCIGGLGLFLLASPEVIKPNSTAKITNVPVTAVTPLAVKTSIAPIAESRQPKINSLDAMVADLGGFISNYRIQQSTGHVYFASYPWNSLKKGEQLQLLDIMAKKGVWENAGLVNVHLYVDSTEIGSFESFGGWHFTTNDRYWKNR